MSKYLALLNTLKSRTPLPQEPSKPSKGAFEPFEGDHPRRVSEEKEPFEPFEGDQHKYVSKIEDENLDFQNSPRLPTLKSIKSPSADLAAAPRCCVCGSTHAGFGHGWSWRSPNTARWFCAEHRPEVEIAGNNVTAESVVTCTAATAAQDPPDWTTAPVPGWPHHLDIFDHTRGRTVRIKLSEGDR